MNLFLSAKGLRPPSAHPRSRCPPGASWCNGSRGGFPGDGGVVALGSGQAQHSLPTRSLGPARRVEFEPGVTPEFLASVVRLPFHHLGQLFKALRGPGSCIDLPCAVHNSFIQGFHEQVECMLLILCLRVSHTVVEVVLERNGQRWREGERDGMKETEREIDGGGVLYALSTATSCLSHVRREGKKSRKI